MVAERDSVVAERDSVVAERDTVVAERDTAVTRKKAYNRGIGQTPFAFENTPYLRAPDPV